MGFPNYDADPNNNTTISGINIAEGCAPSGINNAIRQIMADAKAEDGAVVHKTGAETISGSKTFAGNVSVERTSATAGVYVDNGMGHRVSLQANTANRAGVHDTTASNWMIYNDSAGNTFIPASATLQGGLTVSGTETHSGAVTFASSVTFTGSATMSGGLTVSGGITGVCTSATKATSANTATNASSLGGVAAAGYVTTSGAQVITGEKKFAVNGNSETLWGELSSTSLMFRIKNNSGTAYDREPIRVVGTSSGGDFGYVLGNGGLAILAGGEAAKTWVEGNNLDGSLERAYVVADQNVAIVTNLNGGVAEDGKVFNFTTNGNFSVNGGSGTVDAASFTGNAATATSATSAGVATKVGTATVGSTTKPVYISAGVPVSMTTVGSATNASSLGGVAASGYVQKTAHIQGGTTSALVTSGTTVSAGATKDVSVTFPTSFGGVPRVTAIVRGGSGAYAQNMNPGLYSVSKTGATFRCKNVGGSAFTATADSYVDWIATYL